MSARAALRDEKKQLLQQQAVKFFAEDFIAGCVKPLVPELSLLDHLPRWSVETIRAKGTGRMTLLYRFGDSLMIYAKLYTDDLGAKSYEALRHLKNRPVHENSLSIYTVPEPLGFIEKEKLLLMRSVQGVTLSEMLAERPAEEIIEPVREAARWLVELHRTQLSFIDTEAACERIKIFKLADMLGKAAAAFPEQTSLLLDLLQKIRRVVPAGNSSSALVPTHGQYTPSNIFFEKGRVTVIDLDRLCLSDASKDVAIFVHRMRSMLFKSSGDISKADRLAQIFIDEYSKQAAKNTQSLAYYRALYALKGFAKFAKDYAPTDPARKRLEEFYLSEFERCVGH